MDSQSVAELVRARRRRLEAEEAAQPGGGPSDCPAGGTIRQARGVYDCGVRFALTRAQVIALVRGLVAARPDLTVAEFVRVGRGKPTPARVVKFVGAPPRLARGAW